MYTLFNWARYDQERRGQTGVNSLSIMILALFFIDLKKIEFPPINSKVRVTFY